MEVEKIMQIPISRSNTSDSLMWHYDNHGMYSVRSGYWTYLESLSRLKASGSSMSNYGRLESIWRKIWCLEVPPKVRIFAWRAVRGIIPTKEALSRRHVQLDSQECVFCEQERETSMHVLRDCSRTKDFWAAGPIHEMVYKYASAPFDVWIEALLKELTHDQTDCFVMLLWSIWKQRNKKLWEGDDFNSQAVFSWACKYLAEYKQVHGSRKSPTHRVRTKWRCPPSGRLKMNIDGAFIGDGNKGGVGGVVRDEEGVGIAAFARPYKYALSPFAMELLALRDGLRLATQQGWNNLIIESDSILLISAMNERRGDLSENRTVIADCLELSDEIQVVSYVHAKREANQVADRLASVACGRGVNQVWFDFMPSIIYDVLLFDVSNSVARSFYPMSPPEHFQETISINNRVDGLSPNN